MNQCSCLLAVRACSWWCDGFGGEVKSWIWSSWLWCSFFLWICPLARRGADTRSQLNSKSQEEHLMLGTDRWGKPGVLPSHNNLSETAGPYASRKKKEKKIASTLDSFLCVCDFDMCDVHQRLRCFQGAQNSSACCLGGNKTHYCENVSNNAFFSRDMHKINIFMS